MSLIVLLLIIAVGAILVGCQLGGVFGTEDPVGTLPKPTNSEEKDRAEAQRMLQLQRDHALQQQRDQALQQQRDQALQQQRDQALQQRRDQALQQQENQAIPVHGEIAPPVVDANPITQARLQQAGGCSQTLGWVLQEPILQIIQNPSADAAQQLSLSSFDRFIRTAPFFKDVLGKPAKADNYRLEDDPLRTPMDDMLIFWHLSEVHGTGNEVTAPGRLPYHCVKGLPPSSPAGHLMTDAQLKRVFQGGYFWSSTTDVPHLRDQIFNSLPPWIVELGAWYQWMRIVLEVDEPLFRIAPCDVHRLAPKVRGLLNNDDFVMDVLEKHILRWFLHVYKEYHQGNDQMGTIMQGQTIDAAYAFNPQNWGRRSRDIRPKRMVFFTQVVPPTVTLAKDQLLPVLKRIRDDYLRLDQEARGVVP